MKFEILILFFIFPIVWSISTRIIWKRDITLQEMLINIFAPIIVLSLVWGISKYTNFQATEVLNGKIISKHREHDDYLRSYQCMCMSVSCGEDCTTQRCQTCFENHYTVDWYAKSTLGNIRFKYLDSTSSSVYQSEDPTPYKNCNPGEPASIEASYTNYVKKVPESLFNTSIGMDTPYKELVPSYPRVHSYYKINRVLNVGSNIPTSEIQQLNNEISKSLIILGPNKEANVIVILTNIKDQSYRHVVESQWVGANKNDIVLFLGLDGRDYAWVDVMTWAINKGNELFQVTLRDEVLDQKEFSVIGISNSINNVVNKYYDRPLMKDYEYLKDEIDPPLWLSIICILFSICLPLGLSYYFKNNDF